MGDSPVARRDWLFAAYVAFAGVVFATSGVATIRLRRALARFGDCAAQADATCAAEELATASEIDPGGIRTKLARAELHALLGDVDLAERELGQATGKTSDAERDRATRADILFLSGDIAALRGREDQARGRWIEAAPLVDDGAFVELRRMRLDAARGAASAAIAEDLGALHAALDQLLTRARTGDTAATTEQKSVVDRKIERLPPRMRDPFQRASYACANVANAAASRRRADGMPVGGSGWTPEEPVPPTDEQRKRFPWLQADYERRRDSYFRMKEVADERHFDALRSQTNVIASAAENEEKAVANAQRLIEGAFAVTASPGAAP